MFHFKKKNINIPNHSIVFVRPVQYHLHSLLMLLLQLALHRHSQNDSHPDMHAQTPLFAQAKGIILIRSLLTNTGQRRELIVPPELIDIFLCVCECFGFKSHLHTYNYSLRNKKNRQLDIICPDLY